MFCALNGTVCDRLRRGVAHRAILPVPYLLQKLLSPHGTLDAGDRAVLPLSTLDVIVAVAGSSCWEISSDAELAAEVESVDVAEVAFLGLKGGLAIIPPPLVQLWLRISLHRKGSRLIYRTLFVLKQMLALTAGMAPDTEAWTHCRSRPRKRFRRLGVNTARLSLFWAL